MDKLTERRHPNPENTPKPKACSREAVPASSGVRDDFSPECTQESPNAKILSESCGRWARWLTLVTALSILSLIILAAGVCEVIWPVFGNGVANWLLMTFVGILLILHLSGIVLTFPVGGVFSVIGRAFPKELPRVFCMTIAFWVKFSCIVLLVPDMFMLVEFLRLLDLAKMIGHFLIFVFLSGFAIDGHGNIWGASVDSLLIMGIICLIALIIAVVVVAGVFTVLNFMCFRYQFLIRNQLIEFQDFLKNAVLQAEPPESSQKR